VILKVSCAFCFTTWHDLGFYPGILLSVFIFGSIICFFFGSEAFKGHCREPNRFVFRLMQTFFYFSCFFRRNISHGKRNQVTVHPLSRIQHLACHLAYNTVLASKGTPPLQYIATGSITCSWENCLEMGATEGRMARVLFS